MTEEQRQQWNAALASGDTELIESLKRELLRAVNQRIMDDDPNYARAGWKSGECSA